LFIGTHEKILTKILFLERKLITKHCDYDDQILSPLPPFSLYSLKPFLIEIKG
jgi:hypothetical protein